VKIHCRFLKLGIVLAIWMCLVIPAEAEWYGALGVGIVIPCILFFYGE